MRVEVVYGERVVEATLPDRTHVVSPGGVLLPLEPAEDLQALVLSALKNPVDMPPLKELVNSRSKVTIAFDDPTVMCFAPVWYVGLTTIISELMDAGVKEERMTLLCANALHRKFRHEELAKIMGKELVKRFGHRLLCHDAEDKDNLVYLGKTKNGYDVELNRLTVESDLTVYLNAACTMGFNGGWKSICVGLSTWRSIRWHHTPDIMSMSIEKNRMHEILDEMGQLVEEKVGDKKFFKIETVLASPIQVARMWGGSINGTRARVLELMRKHQVARRKMLSEKVDIVIYGVPDWSPYAVFSFTNPILTLSSTGLGYLGGYIEALGKPGCSVILVTPCPERWDEVHHPSYREIWETVVPVTRDPYQIMKQFEDEFATREDYIEKYRFRYGFHPLHGLMALHPLKRLRHASTVYVAGIEKPELARHIGFVPAESVEEALEKAFEQHGKDASIAFIKYPPAVNRQ